LEFANNSGRVAYQKLFRAMLMKVLRRIAIASAAVLIAIL